MQEGFRLFFRRRRGKNLPRVDRGGARKGKPVTPPAPSVYGALSFSGCPFSRYGSSVRSVYAALSAGVYESPGVTMVSPSSVIRIMSNPP